jgi:hypothetical protein
MYRAVEKMIPCETPNGFLLSGGQFVETSYTVKRFEFAIIPEAEALVEIPPVLSTTLNVMNRRRFVKIMRRWHSVAWRGNF